MTGFGKAQAVCGDALVTVEVKSLNGKTLDASVKLPSHFKELELEVRNIFSDCLVRGKLDCNISSEKCNLENTPLVDKEAFKNVYSNLKALADSVGADTSNLLNYVLNLPEVRFAEQQELSDEAKALFLSTVRQAVKNLDEYRTCEGGILEKDFIKRVNLIGDLLKEVDKFENERCIKIKDRLFSKLKELTLEKLDENRLEQEMIYYLEKLDITEEKIRLRQHLDYFLQCLAQGECQGKKLGFIAQEMGREINTLGSKANDADIQVLVVKMKDELEKIKEQSANIL